MTTIRIVVMLCALTTFISGALPPHIQDAKDRAVIVAYIKENPKIATTLNYIDMDKFIVYSGLKCITTFTRRKKRGGPQSMPGPAGTLYAQKTNCRDSFPDDIRALFFTQIRRMSMSSSKYKESNWEFSYDNYEDAVAKFRGFEKNLESYEWDFHYYFAQLLFKINAYEEAQKQLDIYFNKSSLRGIFITEAFKLWINCEEALDNQEM